MLSQTITLNPGPDWERPPFW